MVVGFKAAPVPSRTAPVVSKTSLVVSKIKSVASKTPPVVFVRYFFSYFFFSYLFVIYLLRSLSSEHAEILIECFYHACVRALTFQNVPVPLARDVASSSAYGSRY